MWYNVIPPFVPLDPDLYPVYPIRTKGLDFSIFRNYIGYIPRNVYLILKQHVVPPTYIPYFVGNQFPIVVQLVTSKERQLVQQLVIAPIPTIVQVTTNLLTYVPRGSAHQPLDGGQLGNSLGGSSRRGDLPREPPFNPLLDLMDGQRLIRTCSYHHGLNHLLCNLYQNYQPCCHIGSYNIQPMSKTLIQMLIS